MKRAVLVLLLVAGAVAAILLIPKGGPKTVEAPPHPALPTTTTLKTAPPDVKLAFEPAALRVERDYDQRGTVSLRSESKDPVRVRVQAKAPDDLPCGFVGRGSDDWYEFSTVEMRPGETWPFPFIVHGNAARTSAYDIPVEALVQDAVEAWVPATRGTVDVEIAPAKLVLRSTLITPSAEEDRARLVRVLEITNDGPTVPDLTVSLKQAPDSGSGDLSGRLWMNPTVEQAVLRTGDSIRIRLSPRLYPGFERLAGSLYLHGNGQVLAVPYDVHVPEGCRVYLTLSRSSRVEENSGQRCTNRPNVSYGLDPVPGTPSSAPPSDAVRPPPEEPEGIPGVVPTSRRRPLRRDDLIKEEDEAVVDTFDEAGETGDRRQSGHGADRLPGRGPPDGPLGAKEREEGSGEEGEAREDAAPDEEGEAPTEDAEEDADAEEDGEGEADAPDVPLRDPRFNTKETTSFRDGEGTGVLVARHRRAGSRLDFESRGPDGRPGTRRTLVRGEHAVRDPVVGRGPHGEWVAAFERDTEEGGSVIEVREVEGDRKVQVGDPRTPTTSANLIRGNPSIDLVFQEGGRVEKVKIDGEFRASEPVVLQDGVLRLLRARRAPDGGLAILTRTGPERVTLRTGDRVAEFDGIDGDFGFGSGGEPVVVVQRSNGDILATAGEGPPETLVKGSEFTGPPSVLAIPNGLRVYYHETAGAPEEARSVGSFRRDFVDGKWKAELRSPQPEQPTTDAAVVLKFSLPWQSAHYKEMNTSVLLNGTKIGQLDRRVPNGRYVFPVPVWLLRFRGMGGGPVQGNVVHLQLQGIGPGNFHVSDQCEIYTRHNLVQEFVAATSEEEAQALAERTHTEVRHGTPDLLLASNAWELPRDVAPGQTVTARIGLFNAGSSPVPEGKLLCKGAGRTLGDALHPAVPSFEWREADLQLTLPADWRKGAPLEITIRADVANDPRPENNVLAFYALRELETSLAGASGPSRIDVARLENVKTVEEAVSSASPHEVELRNASPWYRLKAPPRGRLEVEVRDAPDEAILGVDLFSAEGLPLAAEGGVLTLGTEYVYVRIGLRPGVPLSPRARLKLWWEEPR